MADGRKSTACLREQTRVAAPGQVVKRPITVRQRVAAVVDAVRLMDHEKTADNHATTLIALLGEAWVDIGRVRAVLDGVLASCVAGRTRDGVAYLRLAVAVFERTLDLEHDPRSMEALELWERHLGHGSRSDAERRAEWHDYVARVETEARGHG